jgi:Domain of unknown function (DUF5597)/Beta-galactosidase
MNANASWRGRRALLFLGVCFAACAAPGASLAAVAAASAAAPIPHLETRGHATQLIVDGQPFLILGAELRGTASSTLSNMEGIWPELDRLNLNTVLLALGWDWIEPQEGKFDFALVDGLLAAARQHHKRIVFLWFGTWKNGISSFAPAWVKSDQHRFPRARLQNGKVVEIISPFSRAALQADTRAYVALLEHLKAVDVERTVLMMQMQNEVGLNGDTRDRNPAAIAAFDGAVPAELMAYLSSHKDRLSPELAQRWIGAGAKTHGNWTEVFGEGPITDEIFMAWNYARYMERVTAAGKTVYPLPVFTNTAIAESWSKRTRNYPTGGPQFYVLDIWKAGAPSIDFNSPDVYAPNFDELAANFHRADNPLFIPESAADAHGAANAFYAIGAHAALGYSPFGIDDTAWLINFRPDKGAPGTEDFENVPLAKAYGVLRNLAPLILRHQAAGTIGAAWLNKAKTSQDLMLGDYIVKVELRRSTRDQSFLSELGYGLVMAVRKDEFVVAGSDIQVTFEPRTEGPATAGIADAEVGVFKDGAWVPSRKMNGDDILLNYKLAEQAQIHQSGSGLRFLPGAPVIQWVKLYRFQ